MTGKFERKHPSRSQVRGSRQRRLSTTGTAASTTYLPNIEASFYFFDTGGFAACHKYSNVTPGASILDDPNLAGDLLDGRQYAVVLKSFGSASVAAVNQLQTTGSGALEALSYSGFNGGSTTVYLPNVTRRFYGYDVPLIIQNLGVSSANVTATFTSFSGTQVVSIPLSVGVGLSGVIDPDYDTHGLTDQTQYAVKLTSSQPIGVVANAHSEAGSPVAFSHNGLATGAAALYAPYATKNATMSSPVIVQNVGSASTTAILTFTPLGGGTAQVFTTGSIAAGGSTAFDVRFDNGIALPNAAPCTSASATCLGNGDYSLAITSGGKIAAVVLPNSATVAAGYLAAAAPTGKVVLPVVQRNAAGWNGYIYLQSVAATTATVNLRDRHRDTRDVPDGHSGHRNRDQDRPVDRHRPRGWSAVFGRDHRQRHPHRDRRSGQPGTGGRHDDLRRIRPVACFGWSGRESER